MKTKIKYTCRNSQIELVLDNGAEERQVVAGMTLFEGTGAWMLVDVRLHQYCIPHPYSGGLNSDWIQNEIRPKSDEEREFVKSQLREYEEHEDGSISWCPFEGVVKGTPRENSFLGRNNHIGYFSKKEGLEYLKNAQEWWSKYEGPLAKAKIDNPNRQPTASDLRCDFRIKSQNAADGTESPKPKMK